MMGNGRNVRRNRASPAVSSSEVLSTLPSASEVANLQTKICDKGHEAQCDKSSCATRDHDKRRLRALISRITDENELRNEAILVGLNNLDGVTSRNVQKGAGSFAAHWTPLNVNSYKVLLRCADEPVYLGSPVRVQVLVLSYCECYLKKLVTEETFRVTNDLQELGRAFTSSETEAEPPASHRHRLQRDAEEISTHTGRTVTFDDGNGSPASKGDEIPSGKAFNLQLHKRVLKGDERSLEEFEKRQKKLANMRVLREDGEQKSIRKTSDLPLKGKAMPALLNLPRPPPPHPPSPPRPQSPSVLPPPRPVSGTSQNGTNEQNNSPPSKKSPQRGEDSDQGKSGSESDSDERTRNLFENPSTSRLFGSSLISPSRPISRAESVICMDDPVSTSPGGWRAVKLERDVDRDLQLSPSTNNLVSRSLNFGSPDKRPEPFPTPSPLKKSRSRNRWTPQNGAEGQDSSGYSARPLNAKFAGLTNVTFTSGNRRRFKGLKAPDGMPSTAGCGEEATTSHSDDVHLVNQLTLDEVAPELKTIEDVQTAVIENSSLAEEYKAAVLSVMDKIKGLVKHLIDGGSRLSYKEQISCLTDLSVEMHSVASTLIVDQNQLITDLLHTVAATSIVNTSLHRKLRIVEKVVSVGDAAVSSTACEDDVSDIGSDGFLSMLFKAGDMLPPEVVHDAAEAAQKLRDKASPDAVVRWPQGLIEFAKNYHGPAGHLVPDHKLNMRPCKLSNIIAYEHTVPVHTKREGNFNVCLMGEGMWMLEESLPKFSGHLQNMYNALEDVNEPSEKKAKAEARLFVHLFFEVCEVPEDAKVNIFQKTRNPFTEKILSALPPLVDYCWGVLQEFHEAIKLQPPREKRLADLHALVNTAVTKITSENRTSCRGGNDCLTKYQPLVSSFYKVDESTSVPEFLDGSVPDEYCDKEELLSSKKAKNLNCATPLNFLIPLDDNARLAEGSFSSAIWKERNTYALQNYRLLLAHQGKKHKTTLKLKEKRQLRPPRRQKRKAVQRNQDGSEAEEETADAVAGISAGPSRSSKNANRKRPTKRKPKFKRNNGSGSKGNSEDRPHSSESSGSSSESDEHIGSESERDTPSTRQRLNTGRNENARRKKEAIAHGIPCQDDEDSGDSAGGTSDYDKTRNKGNNKKTPESSSGRKRPESYDGESDEYIPGLPSPKKTRRTPNNDKESSEKRQQQFKENHVRLEVSKFLSPKVVTHYTKLIMGGKMTLEGLKSSLDTLPPGTLITSRLRT